MMKRLRGNKAFTLIELIVVVGIIGILVGIASPRFTGFTKDANVAAMKADTKVLENIASIYHNDNDGWPSSGKITIDPDSELGDKLNGATVRKITEDIEKDNIQTLKNELKNYGIITSKGRYEGDVIHLQGVEGKDIKDKSITHYNSRLNSNSDRFKETVESQSIPGSKVQIGKTVDGVKFFGEVAVAGKARLFNENPDSEMISGNDLASTIGLTHGTRQFSEAGWLKFEIDGKVLFVAKKPFRRSISWDQIELAGAVDGAKVITKDGVTYKVRLMKGLHENSPTSWSGESNHGSEWNRLMLPIHENSAKGKTWKHEANVSSIEKNESIAHTLGADGGLYTNKDLHTNYDKDDMSTFGSYSWMQEDRPNGDGRYKMKIARGLAGVSESNQGLSHDTSVRYGWRPVLEVVQED